MMMFLVHVAFAGKLADGWRGHPYGSIAWLAEPPFEGCAKDPGTGVAWNCSEDVGGVTVAVAYMVEEGTYTGVRIQCDGYLNCSTLRTTLIAAWGKPLVAKEYGQLPDMTWADGNVLCGWQYNQFSEAGSATVFDKVIYDRMKRKKEASAAEAAKGL